MRARLLWTFLVPLGVVLVLVGVVSTAALRHELISQVDSQLTSALARSSSAVGGYDHDDEGPPPSGDNDPLAVRGQGAGTLVVRTVADGRAQGAVLTEGGGYHYLSDAQCLVVAHVPTDGEAHTVDLGEDLGHYRVVASHGPDGGVVITGLPLGRSFDAVSNLVTVEVIAGLAGLLAAAVAGVLVIRRTLRPLEHVAATATRVTELPLASGEVTLAERVPETDTDPRTEVGRVGTALNRLLDHVEESLHARQASETQVRQFVADASHELRTPLASIRGYAEFFHRQQTDGRPPTDEDVAHMLRRVEAESLRMSALVDDLLLLARLDAGRDLELGEVDLTVLVVDAVSDARVAGPGHHWAADVPPVAVLLSGDAARLHQVVANLLANVRTHTPEGTTATARLTVEGGTAVLQVIDDGPGIPLQQQKQVFERFARGDASRSRAAGSTGLGLAIVAAVVAAHDGTVAVHSRPGRTEFTVRLPGAVFGRPEAESVDTDDAPLP
ncbi:sensor histidine kinase [Petropleomorpha daqingensis]|uniref:histidine kinase n=1 Tax=Petropleomorpha daqingensis TaxID=2026353 RepID=A0A853CEN1_9ACTN|nr:HAMP domain-containing sensor histidine kinase [Petropleomorpha daqingensis]NYJ05032.1 two-component system OmpR family sensor kinase [Petropleomorpha daqingensis]